MRRPAFRAPPPATLLAALAAGLAACGGEKSTGTEGPPPLARLTFEQAALDTLSELAARQLAVAGADAAGRPRAATGLVWESSDTAVVAVSAGGLVTARQPGSATVTARSGGIAATLALRVVPVPVAEIVVRLAGAVSADTMLVGTTATVIGEARDLGGRALAGRRVTFAVAGGAPATLDSDGRLTGLAVGAVHLVARVEDAESRRFVVVRPPFAAGLAVRIANPRRLDRDTLWVGLADSVVATFSDSAGASLAATPFRPVTVTSDDPGVLGVELGGRLTPVAPGRATIRVAGDRLVAAYAVDVVRAPVTTVLAAPDTVRVLPGDATQLRPILVDGAGLRLTAADRRVTLRYQSDDPALASVDAQGVVRGIAQGRTTVRVAVDRGSAVVPVRVLAPAGDRAFRISVRFLGPAPTPDVQRVFDEAKARWERVIRETIGTQSFTLYEGSCDSSEPTHRETVTDVLILARVDSIDGPDNILGMAGPCVLRRMPSGRYLPAIGRMTFDSADVRFMVSTGRLPHVIAHEMGHVLGFGTLWDAAYGSGTALAVQFGRDPRYSGAAGMLASAGMGFTAVSFGAAGAPLYDRVPLETRGGEGTAGSHWRRAVFGNELMNGFAGPGPQPLSLLTVQSMADMGYAVSTSAAEPWGELLGTLGNAAAALEPYLGAPAIPIVEQLRRPEWVVDAAGRTTRWPGAEPGRGGRGRK